MGGLRLAAFLDYTATGSTLEDKFWVYVGYVVKLAFPDHQAGVLLVAANPIMRILPVF
jgi:hypothetical protein